MVSSFTKKISSRESLSNISTCREDGTGTSGSIRQITSSRRINCRICLEDDDERNLIAPCECRGTVKHVHPKCLQHWFEVMQTKRCQICKTDYELENCGLKPFSEWTLPQPLHEEWEDQMDFKCAIFWLIFMIRITCTALRYGPNETRLAIMQILGGGKLYYLWTISFIINFVYYSYVIYAVMQKWREMNSIYVWKNKDRRKSEQNSNT